MVCSRAAYVFAHSLLMRVPIYKYSKSRRLNVSYFIIFTWVFFLRLFAQIITMYGTHERVCIHYYFPIPYSRCQNVRAPFHAEFTFNANTCSRGRERYANCWRMTYKFKGKQTPDTPCYTNRFCIESAHSRNSSQDTKTIVGHVPSPLMKFSQ